MTERLTNFLQKGANELIDAVLWIWWVFVIGFFLMYGNVFYMAREDRTWTEKTIAPVIPAVWYLSRTTYGTQAVTEKNDSAALSATMHRFTTPTLEWYLQNRLHTYKTPFSLLPPGKFLRIYRLGVQAPVIDVTYASDDQLKQWAFHDELTKWVVKYPFTANPWEKWNTLLFWHSSVDFRESKDNPFWFIFSHLNELQVGDQIEVVRDGQQYFYAVEETIIKKPTEVNQVMEAFDDGKYITLMACYPRFSTAKRIMVVAKQLTAEEFAKRTKQLSATQNGTQEQWL
jgi:LPXTG-site transpeptidase (sortase) family protein